MISRKHTANKNLTLYFDSTYTGYTAYRDDGYDSLIKRKLPVFQYYEDEEYEDDDKIETDKKESKPLEKGLFIEHLDSCLHVINDALEDHPRTLAIRVDLRLPGWMRQLPDNAISHFIETFKDKIKRDRRRAAQEQEYPKPCTVRYIWSRERNTVKHDHFHVLLLLNQDAYPSLGRFKSKRQNIAKRIKESWALALGIDVNNLRGGVLFPLNAEYVINVSQEPDGRLRRLVESDTWPLIDKKDRPAVFADFCDTYEGLFYRVSYFCKAHTKVFGRGRRSFGCSRLKR